MSFFNSLADDQSANSNETASSENGRLVQIAAKVAAYVEANVADATGVVPASKADAVKFLLAAVGVTTKTELKQAGGGSLASKILGQLSEHERVAVQNLLG